jgi:hypothetical protein
VLSKEDTRPTVEGMHSTTDNSTRLGGIRPGIGNLSHKGFLACNFKEYWTVVNTLA